MKTPSAVRLEGHFVHVVYSPRGAIEGIMLDVAGARVQVVLDKHDDAAATRALALRAGQRLTLEAAAAAPSPKGRGEHPVYELHDLIAVDGEGPEPADTDGGRYRGQVERFNYARHGAVNGVVLDSGHFLHLKPEGHALVRLKIGDVAEAEGQARRLVDGRGWAVDATAINGRRVAGH